MIELVVVVVIIAVISSMAMLSFSSGASNAAASALESDIATLASAIERYAIEHGGQFPEADQIADQLLRYTDAQGNVANTVGSPYIFGPYLRKVPPLPLGVNKGATGIAADSADGIGWIYHEPTGAIGPNTTASKLTEIGFVVEERHGVLALKSRNR